jgi:signal transduction histidine kinase
MRPKVNILMVDDQQGKLLTYEAILAELGENLIMARSGSEALGHLLHNDVAIILMDVNMPDEDGFQLADMVRQHPRHRETAIIFISAIHLTDLDRLKGYQHGGVDYISVPLIPELLRAKVKVFAELYRKTRQLETLNLEMQNLSSRLLRAQDEERRRLAREMHDGLGQELILARMTADAILKMNDWIAAKENVTELCERLDAAVRQVRSISHLLHPALLDEVGLRSALRSYVEGLTKRSGIETVIEFQPSDFPRLQPDLEITVFRIVQEALTNVFRHAEARNAAVYLQIVGGSVVVRIQDDGKGIPDNVAMFRPGSAGVGIGGMRQRVREFGGELVLRHPNPGTIVEARIPLNLATDAYA